MDGCGCDRGFEIFDRRSAEQDLERYQRHGPDTTTRMLLDMIRERGVRGASVLDVGAGIGVIDHELLRAGAGHAVLVDASGPSLEAARSEARRRGHLDRIDFVDGDFVARASVIDHADIVTLDRVVCCYPDMESLVRSSA
jgi:predicted RNA methylase